MFRYILIKLYFVHTALYNMIICQVTDSPMLCVLSHYKNNSH